MTASADLHWIARALIRGGHQSGASLQIPRGTDIHTVWALAQKHSGLTMDQIAEAVAKLFHLPVADLDSAEPAVLGLIPGEIAKKHLVLPMKSSHRQIQIALADPASSDAERAAGFAAGRATKVLVARPDLLVERIDIAYAPERAVESLVGKLAAAGKQQEAELVADVVATESVSVDAASAEPVIRLVNMILGEAIAAGASDIHIQPEERKGVVRYRVDGMLRNVVDLALPVMQRVVSRIKVMGSMDIADRLRPQDGRATVAREGHRFDLRISTVPAAGVEKAVIRILDPGGGGSLDALNLVTEDAEALRVLLKARNGMIVLTGPTGSGKTSTLYAALREIHKESINIMTVEDPVEYDIPGLTQIEVDTKKGVTFASALRACLRQDPDVILVGEIRDPETAEIAAQASLTGHLVLATVHANDAVGAIRRLTDLGLEPATVMQTLRAAVAQRLLRRICPDCQTTSITDSRFKLAAGCETCEGQGFLGRVPVNEILEISPAVEEHVLAQGSYSSLSELACQEGMVPLAKRGRNEPSPGRPPMRKWSGFWG